MKTSQNSHLEPFLGEFLKVHNRFIDTLGKLELEKRYKPGASKTLDFSSEKIRSLILKTRVLLEKSDSKVRHLLPQIDVLVAGTLLEPYVDKLAKAIYQMDSDLSLNLLEGILLKLNQIDKSKELDNVE